MKHLPFLDESKVFGLVPWADAVRALEGALVGGFDPATAPQRAIVDVAHGQLLMMPAENSDGVGVKLGTVTPGNPERGLPRIQALYVLLDPLTHEPRALLDGTALTTLRTPAMSAVAVKHLAAPSASHLVVFGSGPQAWGHVEAIRTVRPIESVTVVGRDRGRAESLTTRLRRSGLRSGVGTPEAVAAADVVACTTTSRTPVFDGRLLPRQVCVVAIGSHEPDARELDEEVLRRAERVVVEDRDVALREAGDAIQAIGSGALSAEDLVGVSEAVGSEHVTGVSVFKSVGMGWQDLVVAELVHERYRDADA